jgi:hypothetical protein
MGNNSWGTMVDWGTVCRRASGRRRYHSRRRLQRALRRQQVVRLLRRYGLVAGVQTKIARQLGCHRSTVCRDVAVLLATPPPIGHSMPTSAAVKNGRA